MVRADYRLRSVAADDERLEAYARLVVEVGLNLQPGQLLAISARLEHAPLARAVARAAYAAQARYVDVLYADPQVQRALIEHAADGDLGYSPPWLVSRFRSLGAEHGALLKITGDAEPEAFAGLDGGRVGRARMHAVDEASLALTDGVSNWTIAGYPNEGWARTIFGEPDVERLWEAVATCVRLDEPDPAAAWAAHIATLEQRAATLDERRFDRLRYRGPGTDLTVGLHPETHWLTALDTSAGIRHIANLPTEEVFTTPDARRTEGTVRSTLPLYVQGTAVHDLVLRFEAGRVVQIGASAGEDVIRAHIGTDDGAGRLGEVALVDRHSRVGTTGLTFHETLFDENASSHLAIGISSLEGVVGAAALSPEERHARGINHSSIHTDFMIGSPELEVDAVTASGETVPLLRRGDWQL